MPELQQASHLRSDPLPRLLRAPPAVSQAQRGQAEGRIQTSGNDRQYRPLSREQDIIRTMTTINNQDDFLEALRNNPAWREAVRACIIVLQRRVLSNGHPQAVFVRNYSRYQSFPECKTAFV